MPRILVIDDEPQVRGLLERFLAKEGFEVVVAADGAAGLRALHATPVDLVITDIVMPEREGIGFIMEARKEFPALRIIAISGGGRMGPESYLTIARELGANRAFAKPLDLPEFLAAVRELLAPA